MYSIWEHFTSDLISLVVLLDVTRFNIERNRRGKEQKKKEKKDYTRGACLIFKEIDALARFSRNIKGSCVCLYFFFSILYTALTREYVIKVWKFFSFAHGWRIIKFEGKKKGWLVIAQLCLPMAMMQHPFDPRT